MRSLIISCLLCIMGVSAARACTAFCMVCGEKWILAKNLDWPVDEGFIFVNRPGIQKCVFGAGPAMLTWKSRYGSITFNQFGKEFPLGGMNSRGLVVEELNMPPYQPLPDPAYRQINEFQMVQYLLDRCASVEEVITAIGDIQVVPALVSLHYLVMDRQGNSMVLEPVDDHIRLYRSGDSCTRLRGPDPFFLPVLSNNRYMESMGYLARFQGFGGDLPVLHRSGSNERFVSVASILSKSKQDTPLETAMAVLDTVSQHDTRWSILYDPADLIIYFKFHACGPIRELPFNGLNMCDSEKVYGTPVDICDRDGGADFRSIMKEENSEQVRNVLMLLDTELGLTGRKEFFDHWISFSNSYISGTTRQGDSSD